MLYPRVKERTDVEIEKEKLKAETVKLIWSEEGLIADERNVWKSSSKYKNVLIKIEYKNRNHRDERDVDLTAEQQTAQRLNMTGFKTKLKKNNDFPQGKRVKSD